MRAKIINIKKHSSNLRDLVDEYNSLINSLPAEIIKSNKLDQKQTNKLCKLEKMEF